MSGEKSARPLNAREPALNRPKLDVRPSGPEPLSHRGTTATEREEWERRRTREIREEILKKFKFCSIENLKANLCLFFDDYRRAVEKREQMENIETITKLGSKRFEEAVADCRKESRTAKEELSGETLAQLRLLADRFHS